MSNITFVSCFYIIKSKHPSSLYIQWMNNLIQIANKNQTKFNLVIFSNQESSIYININNSQNIKVIIKPIEQLYGYNCKDYWIKNHKQNILLNTKTDWKLNMIWCEKVWFVYETMLKKYFDTEYYGWCDIGYFRDGSENFNNWPNNSIINNLNKSKIVYACVNNNKKIMEQLFNLINNKNAKGLPNNQIPTNQVSIAGGFFMIHKSKIEWWANTFIDTVIRYFENNYLIKDDQIILVDCILSNYSHFNLSTLITTNKINQHNWFMFQQLLK